MRKLEGDASRCSYRRGHERKLVPIDPLKEPLRVSCHFMLKESKNEYERSSRRSTERRRADRSSGFAASPLFPILEIICCRQLSFTHNKAQKRKKKRRETTIVDGWKRGKMDFKKIETDGSND